MKVGRDAQDRQQIFDLSDRLKPDLATPPDEGPGVCSRCWTWVPASDGIEPGGGTNDCENCDEVRDALGREPLALSVVSLYRPSSPLRDVLTHYKGRDDGVDPLDPSCVPLVRSMLGRFLVEHGGRLSGLSGGIDAVVVVPSTERPPPHPMEAVVDSLNLDLPRLPLLVRGEGELGFRKPSRDGFKVLEEREPLRVLLVDDVYTTGSRLNSAAFALENGGHRLAAGLVLARRINPEYAQDARRLWVAATAEAFDWRDSPRAVRAATAS